MKLHFLLTAGYQDSNPNTFKCSQDKIYTMKNGSTVQSVCGGSKNVLLSKDRRLAGAEDKSSKQTSENNKAGHSKKPQIAEI